MKKLIMTTVIAACLAVCATVWSQSEAVEETPATPVAQPTAESEVAQEADHDPATEFTPEPASAPTVINPQPGDMVYVPGFGDRKPRP